MQMICEGYAVMKGLLGLKPAEMGAIISSMRSSSMNACQHRPRAHKRAVMPALKLVPAPAAYDGISRPKMWM